MKRRLAVLAVATLISAPAAAQKTYTIGTGGAPTTPWSLQLKNAAIGQSFTAPNVRNINSMRVRFWFNGSPLGNSMYWTNLFVAWGALDTEFEAGETTVDQDIRGWFTWQVRRSIPPSQQIFLHFISDYTDAYYDACLVGTCPSAGAGVPTEAFTRVTSGTAYSGGTMLDPEANTAYDLDFEAQFTTTPEPETWFLMVTGVAVILGLQLRRRKRASS